jgi:polar amino acid transport system substrate-binding protein
VRSISFRYNSRIRGWLDLTKRILFLLIGLFGLPGCRPAPPDALAEVTRRGELQWGGDEEGGAPYIYRDKNDASRLTGFEIDLFEHLATSLNVKSTFKQAQWSSLLNELATANVDCVCNGMELTTERLYNAIATIPYYVYELHCFARPDDVVLNDWNDLRRAKPDGGRWTVGVLEGTAADTVMSTKFFDTVEVKRYSGTGEAFKAVEKKMIDATVTDTPAAAVFSKECAVKQVGSPIERGYYVIYLRPSDVALRDRLNQQLNMALADGTLRTILGRYGLWNDTQELLSAADTKALSETMRPTEPASSNWSVVSHYWPTLREAAGVTIRLSLMAMPIAVVAGLFIALVRLYTPRWLSWPFAVYVEIMRGTPLLLQLLFIYFGVLPALGFGSVGFLRSNAAMIASVIGLAMNYAAYEAEIYRAGLLAIHVGQMEAALSLGLTRWQAIRHVIVPQAVRLVIPPVTNDFINLFKDTAVCSVITVVDLSKMYNIAVNNAPRAFGELALVTALLYLAMSYPLSIVSRRLERPTSRVNH